MKKFFTLFAGLLIASGAFAQEKWTNIVTNGNMEGEQSADWSSFWCHDWRAVGENEDNLGGNQRRDDTGQFQGFAEIVEDPVKPGNHCARVIIRSKEEADAAGNPTTDPANGKSDWAEWDCQFFVYATETIPEGKDIKLTLRVRGEKAGTFQTQAHYSPGDYNHYQLFGDVEYTTEWKKIELTARVEANHTQESNGKFFQSVAFNLSTMQDGNIIYFDDVKFQVRDHQEEGQGEFTGWFNFLRKGIDTKDQYVLSNGTWTTYTGRDGGPHIDEPARIVNDPTDGLSALNVTSIGFNATKEKEVKTEQKDEDGNTIVDEEGNPVYDITYETVDVYVGDNGEELESIDAWRTQFFVSTPHVFKTGEKFRLVMSARAEKPATVSTQMHKGPGDYLHYEMLGNLDLTEEWQTFEFEQEISGSQSGGSTIAFNCNELKEANNYYFRFEEFSVNAGDVKDNERTLDKEDLIAPVPAPEQELSIKVDMSQMMSVLEVEDLTDFLNENTMRVAVKTIDPDSDPEDPEIIETSMGGLQATTGVFINTLGSWVDEEEGINLYFPEEEINGSEAILTIANFSGAFETGNTIETTIRFEMDNWLYAYNLTLMDPEAYKEAAGITVVNTAKKANGAIYDLTGRKVKKASKGLYIKDGKKFIFK